MSNDFYIVLGSLIGFIALYTYIALWNIKTLLYTKHIRLAQRQKERLSKRPWWYAQVKAELARRKEKENT